MLRKIGLIGAGSWGTALVKILCTDNPDLTINWWVRKQRSIDFMIKNKTNPSYLKGLKLPVNQLNISNDVNKIVNNSESIIVVSPAAYVPNVLGSNFAELLKHKPVYSAVKGIIPKYKLTLTDYLIKELKIPEKQVGIIAGPCHAEEVAKNKLSYLTVGAKQKSMRKEMVNALENSFIKVASSKDVEGAELAAVVKNIYAIATGVAVGLGYGDNYLSVLVAHSLAEMNRILKKIYPNKRRITSSAYLGDLLVTAFSEHSRNRKFGTLLAEGKNIKQIQEEMNMVAEGYFATEPIFLLAQQNGVKSFIIDGVFEIIHNNKSPKLVFDKISNKMK